MRKRMFRTLADPAFAWFSSITATVIGLFTSLDFIATLPTLAISVVSLYFFIKKKAREDRHRKFLIEEKERRIREERPVGEWGDDILDE